MKKTVLLTMVAAILLSCKAKVDLKAIPDADRTRVSRVEPLSWWVGMKTPLQILVQGPDISSYDVRIEGDPRVDITAVHKADSPNYLFIDVDVCSSAAPGTYYLIFTKYGEEFKVPYEIGTRRGGSASRKSFSSEDFIYLIMPDRFVDGDESLDAVPRNMESVDKDAFYGRHGGDIAGIASQLDYLSDLGITAIWNTPLLEDNQPHESYHGYACTDYYHIDRRFGTNEDYRNLVAQAHSKGIKMIMDIVTNHCGSAHWWMEDLPFEDWIHAWPEYTHSNCCFSMQNDPQASVADRKNMEEGWFDRSMPDMNLDNPFVLQYFKQWAVWWIEYADLDGLRVDTYPYNEKYPMSEWCKAVRAEYPGLNIVGEVWTRNVPQLAYWQGGNPNKDGFDSHLPAIMDFPLHSALCQALTADKVNWDEGMVKVYDCVANDLYYHDLSNMLIFPGNHDIDRIADIIGRNVGRQKIAMTLISTLRGIPQLLYADELMAVSRDRSQGHGGLRIDFPLDWRNDPVAVEMHDFCSKLFNWRKKATAVHNGRTKHFLRRDNTYAYFRYNDNQVVFVFVNNSAEPKAVPWADYAEFTCAGAADRGASSVELLTGAEVLSAQQVDFSSDVVVAPQSAIVVDLKL
ncbi:MAG: glycoside hydrolase family 13 protein [Candidatus Cryptobacteroides sp.]